MIDTDGPSGLARGALNVTVKLRSATKAVDGILVIPETPTALSGTFCNVKTDEGPGAHALRALARDDAVLTLLTPQYGIAPGQAAVCYVGDRSISGGWIRDSALCQAPATGKAA